MHSYFDIKVCLYICPSVSLSVSLSVRHSVCLRQSVRPSIRMSVSLSISLSVSLSVSQWVILSVRLSVSLTVSLSVSPSQINTIFTVTRFRDFKNIFLVNLATVSIRCAGSVPRVNWKYGQLNLSCRMCTQFGVSSSNLNIYY